VTQAVHRIDKPWGYELIWATTDHYLGKVLHIRRDERLSLQLHRLKEETILLVAGRMMLVFESETGDLVEIPLEAGQAHHIPVGRRHRMIAVEDCDVVEVSTPFPDDVVRLEDSYGRAGTSST
jgi:mannose-6-phosphate isomerase